MKEAKDLEKLIEIKDRIIAALEKEISILKSNQNNWLRPYQPFWYGSGVSTVTNGATVTGSIEGLSLNASTTPDEPCYAPV